MRVTLIALKPTFYHRVGAHFDASPTYAKMLIKLGVARHAEVDEPSEVESPPPILQLRKKRTYKRRDMSAEGTGE